MKLTILFATLGLAAAIAGESHRVTLYTPAQINGKSFKTGEIKVDIENGNVIVKQGKTSTELKATVDQGSEKFLRTSVGIDGDTKAVKEIRLAGTNTTLTFPQSGAVSGN